MNLCKRRVPIAWKVLSTVYYLPVGLVTWAHVCLLIQTNHFYSCSCRNEGEPGCLGPFKHHNATPKNKSDRMRQHLPEAATGEGAAERLVC